MEYNEVKNEDNLLKETRTYDVFYRSITSIQAIAIIGVIIFHIGDISSLRLSSNIMISTTFEIIESSVDVFIFLSGMLLTIGLMRKASSKIAWGKWYKKRIVRIYPLLIISTFGFLLSRLYISGEMFSIHSVLNHMSGLQSIPTNPDFFKIAPPHWYITLILGCYLLFPVFFYVIRRNAKLATIIAFIIYLSYLFFANTFFEISADFTLLIFNRNLDLWYYSLFTLRFILFFFGALFGFWIGSDPKRIEILEKRWVGIVSFVGLLFVISLYFLFPITNSTLLDFRRILYHMLIPIFFFIFSIYFFSKLKRINTLLEIPGKASYEIYLFHLIFIEIMYYKIIEYFSLHDNFSEIYFLLIPILTVVSIILTVPFYLTGRFFQNEEKTHKTILFISFSLIFYALIVFLFKLDTGMNNLISTFLFGTIILAFIVFYYLFLYLNKSKNEKSYFAAI